MMIVITMEVVAKKGGADSAVAEMTVEKTEHCDATVAVDVDVEVDMDLTIEVKVLEDVSLSWQLKMLKIQKMLKAVVLLLIVDEGRNVQRSRSEPEMSPVKWKRC